MTSLTTSGGRERVRESSPMLKISIRESEERRSKRRLYSIYMIAVAKNYT